MGLEGRLAGIEDGGEPKDDGMPSRITSAVPSSSIRFGNGKLESGPAILCNTSYDERRLDAEGVVYVVTSSEDMASSGG